MTTDSMDLDLEEQLSFFQRCNLDTLKEHLVSLNFGFLRICCARLRCAAVLPGRVKVAFKWSVLPVVCGCETPKTVPNAKTPVSNVFGAMKVGESCSSSDVTSIIGHFSNKFTEF